MPAVSEAYVKAYSDVIELVSRTPNTRLQQAVTMTTGYRGEKVQPVRLIGGFEFAERVSRHEPTKNVEPDFSARAIAPRTWQVAPVFDRNDHLFTSFDPQGPLVQEGKRAFDRKKNAIIVENLFAPALTGKDGTTIETWDTARDIAISEGGANTPWNYDKFLAARELLSPEGLEDEEAFMLISEKQQTAMLKQIEVIGTKFKLAVSINAKGQIESFMGVGVIVGDYPQLKSGTTRYVPMWLKGSMHLGMWDDLFVSIDKLVGASHSTQVFHEFTANATRLKPRKLVRMLCFEA